jgi:hypothetical protein
MTDVFTDFVPLTVLPAVKLNAALRAVQADADAAAATATLAETAATAAETAATAAEATAAAAAATAAAAAAEAAAAEAAAAAATATANEALAAAGGMSSPGAVSAAMTEALAAMAAATAAAVAAAAAATNAASAQTAAASAQAAATAAAAAAAAAQATANEALAAAQAAAAAGSGVAMYPPKLADFTGGWLNQSGSGFVSSTEDDADGLTVTCTQVGSAAGIPGNSQALPGASRMLKLPAPAGAFTAVLALDLSTVGPAIQAAGIGFWHSAGCPGTAQTVCDAFGFGQLDGLTSSIVVSWTGSAAGCGIIQWNAALDTVGVAGNYTQVGVFGMWQCRGTGLLWIKVRDDGTGLLTASASNDGIRWAQVAQRNGNYGVTGGGPDTVGLAFLCAPGIAAPAPLIAVIKSWQLIPG